MDSVSEKILSLPENELRVKVVLPLLYALGVKGAIDRHGSREKGKDVIYPIRDHFLRATLWGAIVLKAGDLGKGDVDNLNRQVGECLNRFADPDELRGQVQVHEIVVMTSGRITVDLEEFIRDHNGREFPSIIYVNGPRLVYLIGSVMVEYRKRTGLEYEFEVDTFAAMCGYRQPMSQPSMVPIEGGEVQDI
jgi:hypothetical protein